MHESPRDLPVEAPLPPELSPYIVLETESAQAPVGSRFQGWWVLAWQSRLPVLQIEKGRSHAVGRCMTLKGDGQRTPTLAALQGAGLFITTERHWLADAARLRIPTVWVADGRPDCSALTGRDELAPGTGLPPESALFEPGLFQAVFSHTPYRRELPLRRLFEAVQKMVPGILHDDLSESSACRDRMLPHLRGRIADIGHGGCKILPQALGVDFFQYDESDWIGDARDLWFFQDQHFDTVYSSHCLEDLWHPHQALEEWTRILRIGGRLCLYLPLKDHYPNVGTPGCNPGHKDDYEPEDVEAFLRDLGHMDLLVSERRESEDSFEVIAEKKQGRSFFLLREKRETPKVSVLIPGPVSEEPREDARSLQACIESAHASLEGIAHEILVLDRSAADGDARAGLRDLAARHAEVHVLEDRSPATWPQRLTKLHRSAKGTWICVLDGQSLVLDSALRELVEQAEHEGASAAEPQVLDQKGQLQDPEVPPCLLIRKDLDLLIDTQDTAFLTGLYLRCCMDQLRRQGQQTLRVQNAQILHGGWSAQPLTTIKLSSLCFDRSLLTREKKKPYQAERVLLTMFRTLGDCILATPILEELKNRDAACRITVLTERRYAWIFENHPHVEDLIVVQGLDDKDFVIHEDAALLSYLRSSEATPFDRLIFLSDRQDQVIYHQSGSSLQAFYARLAGLPDAAELRPRVFLSEGTQREARQILDSLGIHGNYAILHRKAGWSNKDISPELAQEIVLELQRESGLPIIQIGGPGEGIGSSSVIDLCGQLEAAMSAALIQQATLHIGPDSGPLHLASSYDTPSLGLYAGSGIRVAPTLSWNSAAIQSPSSCGISCGNQTCTQRRPCNEDLDLAGIKGPLVTLLEGESIRREYGGNQQALYLASPSGDQWVCTEALPESSRSTNLSAQAFCEDGPSLTRRSTPLAARDLAPPPAAERKQAWILEIRELLSDSSGQRGWSSAKSHRTALQKTLDRLPPWTALEAERSLATQAGRSGDNQGMVQWLMEALDRSETIALEDPVRSRAAYHLIAEEIHFDLCRVLQETEDRLPLLVHLLERHEERFGERAPLLPVLAVIAAEGGVAVREEERLVLDRFLGLALDEPDPMTDSQLILLSMALTRIGHEQQAAALLEDRLHSTPEDRCEQRAPLALRLGFLLAMKPEALQQARILLTEAVQGLEDENQRSHVAGLLGRIDTHLGGPETGPDSNLLQPQPCASASRSYRSGSLNVREFSNIESLATELGFKIPGRLLEPDLDIVENECELDDRKRRDGEVLTWMAANLHGNVLDLGTSHGRSAFKFATNLRKGETVFTVNALPEQIHSDEKHITHKIDAATIGSYYRDRGITNVEQIFANTMDWVPADNVSELACVFVDANHDGAAVYADSTLTWRLLREGGYLIWHDFCPAKRNRYPWIDSVMQGIEAFLHAHRLDCEVLHLEGSWIGLVRKTSVITSTQPHLEHI